MTSHLTRRNVLFLTFAFAMTATLSFLGMYNMANTEAASFQAGNIISDTVMANYNSMTEANIQSFLKSKNSCNNTNTSKTKNNVGYFSESSPYSWHVKDGHYVCMADESFNGESAAHIIWQAAQDYRINPQVLIVLLQKEQGLVTDTLPNSIQYRKATGYGCPDTAACSSKYYGFKNQIRQAAAMYRTVLDGGYTNYPVGNNYVQYHPNKSCGGSTVYIANRATSALYRYTPYQPGGGGSCESYGNSNFYKYFTQWFGDTHAIADIKSVYVADGTYTLGTVSGKVMSFTGTKNGSAAQVATKNNNDNLQKFTLEKVDYQYYRIKNVSSGRYLDVNDASTKDGAKIQLWDGNNTCAQKWSLEIINAKSYKLRNACSYKSLDINNAATNTNGAKIQLWSNNNTSAQQWVLTNTDSAPVGNGTYNIVTTGGKSLALTNENTTNSTKMVTGELHSATTERFQLTRSTDGFYKVKNVASGRYLDVDGAKDIDGTSVQIYDGNTTCAQRWAIKKTGDNYTLTSACSGKPLDVNNAKISSNNTKIQIWSSNNSNAQTWKLNTPTGRTIADGTYTIESGINNKYNLDVDGGAWPADGTNIQLWSKNDTNSQKFQVTYNESTGYYTIKSIYAGRGLDVSGASKKQGANIQAWSTNDSCAQKWMITPINNNYYHIISGCSRLALDANNATAKNGTNIQTWSSNTSNAQKWKFNTTAISKKTAPVANGTYMIHSGVSKSLYLDANGGIARNGTNIQIWSKNSSDAQKFQLSFDSTSGYYTIKNIATKRNLDVNNANARNSTNIQVWSSNTTCAQKWQLTALESGYYRVTSACNSKYSLDVNGASTKIGTNVQLWQNNTSNAQKWQFIKQ